MLTFHSHQHHGKPDFTDYLQSKGYSHSFLKYNINGSMPEIATTEKMQLGSMVDAILSGTPARTMLTNEARAIATYIDRRAQWLRNCKSQQHYTATAEYAGLQLPVKTLVDFVLPGYATVELKVSDCKVSGAEAMIQYMGYDNQCLIEHRCANVGKCFLLVYCRKDAQIYFKERKPSDDWMIEQVMNFGTTL